jgi:hypothetical protein
MGLVHTSIRSKLGVEKVRKATMVGMDIKQMHLEAGLLYAGGKWNFTPQESDATPQANHPDISNDDLLDFDQLCNHLIVGAVSANNDKDAGDNNDDLPTTVLAPPLTITIPPLNSAALSLAHQATSVKKTSISLKIFFKYPAATDLPSNESGMNSFWRGGIQNLENKMEAYDLLSLSEENADVINPEIQFPTMHWKNYITWLLSLSLY